MTRLASDKKDVALKPQFLRALTNGEADENGTIWFTASTEGTKRDGLSLAAEDWRMDNFVRNPVFLWDHNMSESHDGTPIGKVDVQMDGNTMRAGVTFDDEDDFAIKIRGKYERGFLNAVSVRWLPTREEGARGSRGNIVNDLLEISATPIPVDPDALVEGRGLAIQADKIGDEELKEVSRSIATLVSERRSAGPLNHSTLSMRLEEAVDELYGVTEEYYYPRSNAWIASQHDDFVVVMDRSNHRYYKHAYSTDEDGNVTLEASKVEVISSWTEVNLNDEATIRTLAGMLSPKGMESLARAHKQLMFGEEAQPEPEPEPEVETANVAARAVASIFPPAEQLIDPDALMRAMGLEDPV